MCCLCVFVCFYLNYQKRLYFVQFALRGPDLRQCLSFYQVRISPCDWMTCLVLRSLPDSGLLCSKESHILTVTLHLQKCTWLKPEPAKKCFVRSSCCSCLCSGHVMVAFRTPLRPTDSPELCAGSPTRLL